MTNATENLTETPDKDIILNKDYVVVTRKGEGQQVTLVNPTPKFFERENSATGEKMRLKIVSGFIVESGPDSANPAETITKLYTLSDMSTQDQRSKGVLGEGQVQALRGAPPSVLDNGHKAHRAKWKATGGMFDADISSIGEFNSANIHTLPAILDKMLDAGQFGEPGESARRFRDAVVTAVDLSCQPVMGDGKAIAKDYEGVNTEISETVKGPKK